MASRIMYRIRVLTSMKAALTVLVVATAAIALAVLVMNTAAVVLPMQRVELEKARPIPKTARLGTRLGDVYTFCSELEKKTQYDYGTCVYIILCR